MDDTTVTTTTEAVVTPPLTLSQLLAKQLQNGLDHPKSTIQSILTSAMGLDVLLLACGCLNVKATAIAFGVMTVCKVDLGITQIDGAQITLPAGTKLTSESRASVTTPSATLKP